MKKRIIGVIAVILSWTAIGQVSFAGEMDEGALEQAQETIWSQLEFDEVEEALTEIFPEEKLDFSDTVKAMISGEMDVCAETINQLLADQIGYAFRVNRQALVHMVVLMIFAAIFTNFAQVFRNKQISQIGFYVVYMLVLTLALQAFGAAISWTEDGIGHLTAFMKALCPIYFLAVAIAKGSVSSVAFYNIALLLIFLIEIAILKFVLPVIHIYIMVRFLNFLSEEDYLSKFTELMEMAVIWTLKALLACVVGLNVIQGLIAPAIDSVKRSALTRGAEAIPGVGDALGGMAEVVLGTAVLVKNGIGMAGAVVCICICIVPMIQMAVLTFLYKLLAAIMQPVSDKRMVECISSVGEGCQMLLKLIVTVAVLFLLTIAIVAATTGGS